MSNNRSGAANSVAGPRWDARRLIAGTAAAAAVGAVWTLSPLALLAACALLAMCVRATSDLQPGERRRVRTVLSIAIAVRLVLIGIVFATTPATQQAQALFPDAHYIIGRSIWLRNLWMRVPLGPHQLTEVFNPYGASSFTTFLAVLQVPAGPAPFGLSFLSVLAYVAGALAMFHAVRRGFGPAAALLGLAIVLGWPSLMAWSISVLKEPAQLFLTAMVCAGAAAAWGPADRRRLLWLAGAAGALGLLATLRAGSMEIAVGGLALAAALRLVVWRRWVLVILVALALAGGWRLRERIGGEVRLAATRHIGHIKSAGVGYRLLADPYYSNTATIDAMSLWDGARFLATAAVAFVVVPFPWQVGSRGTLALLPQQFAWYVMCAAALAGFVVGVRRAPWLTCVLAGSALAGLAIIAPNSGNVGTLLRHRDLIVPSVLWLGALGLASVAQITGEPDAADAAGMP